MLKIFSEGLGMHVYDLEFVPALNLSIRLFSKFTISTTSHQHIRVCNAELTAEEGLDSVKIGSCVTKNRQVIVG